MDICTKTIVKIRLEKAAENLRKNNMDAYVVDTCGEAVAIVKSLLREGETICSGGSMSLEESGVLDLVRNDNYNYIDRAAAKDRAETEEVYRKAFSCDTYLCSSNAVTENGELYNVDGNSNRVAAICYGPKSVVMVLGSNKLVRDIPEAINRIKRISAPANVLRLGLETYCGNKGECMSLDNGGGQCDGCRSESRVCCNYVVSAYQRHKSRIKVVLVNEEIGY